MHLHGYFSVSLMLLIASSSLVACSTQHSRDLFSEQFVTEITAEGVKKFQITLHPEQTPRKSRRDKGMSAPDGSRPPRGMGPKRGGGLESFEGQQLEVEQRMREQLLARLTETINSTGFCREGYTITDEQIGMALTPALRGECHDKATESDRQTFASQQDVSRPLVIYEDLGGA